MDMLHTLILALVRGLTEFLPVSGAAHLQLVTALTSAAEPGPAFEFGVHLGLLGGVTLYLRHDLAAMTGGWVQARKNRIPNDDSRLVHAVALGVLPWAIARLLAGDAAGAGLNSPMIVAATALAFALALGWADARGRQLRCEYRIRRVDVLAIGCAQVLALVPGVPRAGVTMAAGRMTGLDRKAAARFSFLLSIPALALEAGRDLPIPGDTALASYGLSPLAGAGVAAVSAYLAIHVFLKLLDAFGMRPFSVYQLVICAVLFVAAGAS